MVAERRLEVAVRDRLGGRAQSAQAEGDELREQEPDDDADHAGDHACSQRLAVDRVDRLCGGRLPADGDEHAAVVGDCGHEHASVGGSLDQLLPGTRNVHDLPLEAPRRSRGFRSRHAEEPEADVSLQLSRYAVEGCRRDRLLRRRLRVRERLPFAVTAERRLGAVGELCDHDRGRRRSDDGERDAQPPANPDERFGHD